MSKKVRWMAAACAAGLVIVTVGVAAPARAAILADSVADFTADQSQGYNGWTYLIDRDDAAPALMDTPSNPDSLPSPSWSTTGSLDSAHRYTTIWNSGAHPGGNGAGAPGSASAIRRWTNAAYSGLVDITGTAQLEDPSIPHGNGTSMGIYLNGVLLPGGTGSTINMPSTGLVANPVEAFSFLNVSIVPGDTIDFVLFGGQNLTFGTNIQSDATDLSAIISEAPEPASVVLLASGAVLALARRKRA